MRSSGKEIEMDKNARKHACTALLLIAMFSLVVVLSPVQKADALIAISSISPLEGYVGSTITVDGTIDTLNGSFTVRWDGIANVATGQAVNFDVHTSFVVPSTTGNRSIIVELIDDLFPSTPSSPVNFRLLSRFDMSATAPTSPLQLREGSTIPISINVTGGEGNKEYTANITVKKPSGQVISFFPKLSNTTSTGFGQLTTTYPTNFPSGANSNFTGIYVFTLNETSLEAKVQIGLTDKISYLRNDTVQIQAAGYKPGEIATVDIKTGGSSLSGFPRNVTADFGGLVKASWKVPLNAAIGTYAVSVANSTSSGTVKSPLDAQTFDVFGLQCRVTTTNGVGESLPKVLVEVYNATVPNTVLLQGSTNSTGQVSFYLDDGNYTFKAFYRNVNVGVRANESLSSDTSLNMRLNLVNLAATVQTESSEGVPFVDVALKYKFTTRFNQTVSETLSMSTNLTGKAELHNLFTNKTYVVEAKRYDLLFSNTTFNIPSSASALQSLTLTLPTYIFSVHALDAKDAPISGIQIKVYEWTSGITTPLQSLSTNNSGYASFSLPFGIYRLRAYKGEDFLGETTLYLISDQLNSTFSLSTVNVDVTVSVFDYFGRPISNVEVRIERKTNQEYVPVDSKSTGADGSALFASMLGGDSRVSVYVAGRLAAAKTQFLGADSSQVTFNIGEFVAIVGYPVETGVFTMLVLIVVLVIISLVLLNRKRLSRLLSRKPKN